MAASLTVPRNEHAPPARKSRPVLWVVLIGLVAVVAGIGALYLEVTTKGGLREALKSLRASETAHTSQPPPASPVNNGPWNGVVEVTGAEEKAIGFSFAKVQAQTSPMRLELTGHTAYDENTITKIRPRFDARVQQVFAEIGQKIKKGDPLVELYSTDLATAKSEFQTKYVQWRHDRKLLDIRTTLVDTGAISRQVFVDTQNDEQKSRLDFLLAEDKLAVYYEIPKQEIDPLLERLSEKTVDPRNFGDLTEKAKLTLRSKTDGYVIKRDVVPGNYYKDTDVLMEIAPLDHLWVWVNVFELDQDKVREGQTIEIQFPYLSQKIQGKVNYVAPEVSKATRAVQIRAVVPNPEARLKADMLVKALLQIPPVRGHTVVPRLAMVAISGNEYVFVRKTDTEESRSEKDQRIDQFERIKIRVAQENMDHVVVASGLKPDQEVVTNGSLILSQLYEDRRMTTSGMPAQ